MDDNKTTVKVDYLVHESIVARLERLNKRLFVLCMVIFLAFVGSNLAWIYYENQFEDIVTTVSQDAISDGGDAIIHGDHAGAVIYGEGKTNNNN